MCVFALFFHCNALAPIYQFHTFLGGTSKKSTLYIQGVFLTGSALKVLSVGDGKIHTKKVKVRVSHRENMKF